ncbi:MAG: hypothetical protein ACOC2K_03925 [Bacteroidota bacterium]
MAKLKKTINTEYSADEMRHFADTKVLPNSAVKSFVDTASWSGNILYLTSKFGKGTIEFRDKVIDIDIDLNMFGSMAKNTLESRLDNEFKQLKKRN